MEELVLTDPIVVPETVSAKYHVIALTLDMEAPGMPGSGEQGLVAIRLRDNLGLVTSYSYTGTDATDLIKWMNTANFSTTSMHKRILQKLSTDGHLPGTVTGTPDP